MHITPPIGGILGVHAFASIRFAPLLRYPVKTTLIQASNQYHKLTTLSHCQVARFFGQCLKRRDSTSHLQRVLGFRSAESRSINTSVIMALNGETRHKRKTSPINIKDRPAKLFKANNPYNTTNGDDPPDRLTEYDYLSDGMEEEALQQPVTATADTAEWQATIEQVVKNVVSIHFCQTCSFDTDAAVSSEATGFVVDAKRGYILTNRHVVGAGPFWGYCIFDNHEEVRISV